MEDQIIPHLFKTEYRKIISVLVKMFGFEHIEIAEDIASDTFLTASKVWAMHGYPENPVAWLYKVAKNKATNQLKRQHYFQSKIIADLTRTGTDSIEIDLSEQNISDSQLQMMFTICHPSISPESQVCLSLRILCGFGIEEIADAFLTNKETINKRIYRAKEKLRQEKINISLPGKEEMEGRLAPVLLSIYLLFNEGYYSESNEQTIRKDLCVEAMRLCKMLTENTDTARPEVFALLSLMCFHSSRFEARLDRDGSLILYDDQDVSLWDQELIKMGVYYLKCSATGNQLTKYHLEANIAYWNTRKEDTKEKWENILQLYNLLLQIEYSPVAAMNRTYALSKANGKPEAIIEAEKLQLTNNHFYYALLGELYTDVDNIKAKENYSKSLSMAKTEKDRQTLLRKLKALH